jgi:hypothetical protein
MMSREQFVRSLACASLVLMSACAKPPTQEMAAAENSVKTAIQAGAKDYAPSDIALAQAALADAQAKLAAKDYPGAKTAAGDAQAKADAATSATAANREMLKNQVVQSMQTMKPLLDFLQTQIAGLKGKNFDQVKADSAALSEMWTGVEVELKATRINAAQQKFNDLQSKMDAVKAAMEEAKKAPAQPVKQVHRK